MCSAMPRFKVETAESRLHSILCLLVHQYKQLLSVQFMFTLQMEMIEIPIRMEGNHRGNKSQYQY